VADCFASEVRFFLRYALFETIDFISGIVNIEPDVNQSISESVLTFDESASVTLGNHPESQGDSAKTFAAPRAIDIEVQRGDKTFSADEHEIVALSNINLQIYAGEFFSLLGPSGCGKSTLLKCVAGLERFSAGTLNIRGKSVTGCPEGLGVVFQRDLLVDWRSVLENVLLMAEFRGIDRSKAKARARELLTLFDLSDYADRSPWQLSGGMRQRASICRALVDDPAMLLMDEPFGALDAMTRDQLNAELQRIWIATRKTVLFITHSIAEAVFLSDRVAVMSRNPGTIIEIIDIDLPRPRALSVRDSPKFAQYTGHLRDVFLSLGILKNK
jgi:NitT/TauT family transport system ATP-binding protein